MIISKYGMRTLLFALFFFTTTVYSAEEINNEGETTSPKIVDTSSTKVPLAENNSLQETPEYKGTDQQITDPTADPKVNKSKQQTKIVEPEAPYEPAYTNSAWEQFDVPDSFYDNPYQVSLFSPENGEDGERLWSQTTSIFYYGLGVVAVLAVMPEEITNWDNDDDVNLGQKWIDNVTAGPVWDRDDAVLNLVMHPYFGGVYYQAARKSGYRQWDSFLYSALMSTVFWEYGVEAFAETPSMQDLVITPVLGWVYGEWAFNTEREIWTDGGTVWGSEYLGNTALFLLDPVDSVGRNVNRLFGTDLIKAGTGYVKLSDQSSENSPRNDQAIMFEVNYVFGEENSPAQSGISGKRKIGEGYSFGHSNDPVSYGIIGLSLGAGYLNFDSKNGSASEAIAQTSLGLYFSRSFSARLSYSSTKMIKEIVEPTNIYESFSVDGQYYFNTKSDLRPYITAGVGEEIWEESKDRYNFQVNTGLGIHYRLNANWALQAEAVNYYTPNEGSNDQQVVGKLLYRFGDGENM
ncbi:DUF3943 domain-containing protein [Psychromonas sp. RZ22]|uniref:DUF3943 domain-containing protein n=1 Tax=Psychromonas algarum TaxID=2555643 RepID=UPI0010689F23|nr:DUF3943 domain-containing protein [Psychromonas sp. RZ22]TEW53273.1 DUF3943 domain-containing protein [Psychromonas sp. RZ22]